MKKIFAVIFGLVLIFSVATTVSAQSPNAAIPEKNGDYPDPEHPEVRVRVFVHVPKTSKPALTQSGSLVCNLSDPDSFAVVPPAGWKLPSTWTYTLNTGSVPRTVGSGNLATIANNAFTQWTNAVGSKVSISKTSSNTTINKAKYDGKNIIAWGQTSASALAITYTWYYPSTGIAAEEDTIFNKQYPWFWNSSNNMCTNSKSYDAQDILTHELGHWMGLNDTYDLAFTDNTMFGYGSTGEVKKDTLTTGDILGVQAIYP